jgi:hypothetical protein
MSAETVVVVVHYGEVETTVRSLEGLAGQGGFFSVILSSNTTPEEAQALSDRAAALWSPDTVRLVAGGDDPAQDMDSSSVTVVDNGGNSGFAAGCNVGIREALQRPATRYVWLLNNDARPAPGALQALVREADGHPRALLGATVLDAESGDRLQLAGGAEYHPATTRIRPQHAGASFQDVPDLSQPRLDYVYGASLFAPASLYREVGLLDEAFFLFYEELDLCRRAQAAGYGLRWCRECVVVHEVSATVGRKGRGSARQARQAAFHEARSTILFTRKHHPLLLPMALAARTAGKLAALLVRGEWGLVGPSLAGLAEGLWAKR